MPTLPEPVRVTIADDGLPYAGRGGYLIQTLLFLHKGIIRLDDGKELNGQDLIINLDRIVFLAEPAPRG